MMYKDTDEATLELAVAVIALFALIANGSLNSQDTKVGMAWSYSDKMVKEFKKRVASGIK